MDDGLQIIEQILPYFQPDFNVVMEEVPALELKRDIPIELTGLTLGDEFEVDFAEKRIVNWSLEFEVKGWLYPPVREQEIVESVEVSYTLPDIVDEDGDGIDQGWVSIGV